jgi:hypothetical protein
MTVMKKTSALLFLMLSVPVCVAADIKGTVLWYMEQEAGNEPYKVRYIVTSDFMRSDEGETEEGFVLFDRKQRQIFSVVPENETILHVNGKGEAPDSAKQLKVEIRESIDDKAPRVAGKSPVTLELVADGESCYSAIVVPGFLEQARLAFLEFNQALAVQQVRTLGNTPQEYQTPCFLSRYVYTSDFYLQRGLPLLDWGRSGERSELISYETDVVLDEQLFQLPQGLATIRAAGN